MRTGRQSTKIVDPKTGARVADPDFVGVKTSSGSTGTSWPEVRKEYQSGKRSAEFDRKNVPSELKSYLTGKTDRLSEDYDEPVISSGGDVRYTRTIKEASVGPVKTESKTTMTKLPTKSASEGMLKGPEKLAPKKTVTPKVSGMFYDYSPAVKDSRKARKEVNRFESYSAKTPLGENFIGRSAQDISQYKGEMKSQRKEYRKEGNKDGIKATSAEIRQARGAAKYAGMGNKSFDVESSRNYQSVTSKSEEFKNPLNNPANRNTIYSQISMLKKK